MPQIPLYPLAPAQRGEKQGPPLKTFPTLRGGPCPSPAAICPGTPCTTPSPIPRGCSSLFPGVRGCSGLGGALPGLCTHEGRGGGNTHPSDSQEKPAESQDQEEDNWKSVGSLEPATLVPVVSREELLQFLKSMWYSGKKVKISLHY